MEVVGLRMKEEIKATVLNFDTETELRLGLPGGGGAVEEVAVAVKNSSSAIINANGKRGFEESGGVDLKLNLSSSKEADHIHRPGDEKATISSTAKAQVVGWPPVGSFRKNILQAAQKSGCAEESEKAGGNAAAALVKVSMDGAPYLRKVDLKTYLSYQELSDALVNMFRSFAIGKCGAQGMKDFLNESKLTDLLNGSDYVPTYEDSDGDWLLVGDVPWEMFVESCKRLRIMKGKEAVGLAPRAMEKRKSRR